jgi:SAM-dependent methyltransferase
LTLRAAARAGSALDALWCVDWSATVATRAAERLEGPARAVSADLAALPFTDGGLDLAVSQYGLEYAGEAAFSEAARVLAPGGALIALVHDSEGGVAAECRQTSAFFDEAAEIAVIPLARAAFAAGFEADRAPQRRAGLITARQALQPALARLARLVARESDATAMQFLRQVRRDLLIMLARRQAYAPEDVFGWLDKVENEIAAYRHRMASMLAAARSAAQIDQVAAIFRAAGCEVEPPRRVLAGSGAASIGWALRARRPMAGAP